MVIRRVQAMGTYPRLQTEKKVPKKMVLKVKELVNKLRVPKLKEVMTVQKTVPQPVG